MRTGASAVPFNQPHSYQFIEVDGSGGFGSWCQLGIIAVGDEPMFSDVV